jgi:hypothetical protein
VCFLFALNYTFSSNCHRFHVISAFNCCHSLREVVLTVWGRHKSNLIRPFDSRLSIYYSYSVESFCLSITVQKLFNIFVWLGNPLWGPNFRGFGGKRPPKRLTVSMRLPKGTSLRQTASFEPLSVSVGLAVWAGREPKEREKR